MDVEGNCVGDSKSGLTLGDRVTRLCVHGGKQTWGQDCVRPTKVGNAVMAGIGSRQNPQTP